jgi:crotonobetainyl-CoA:carnitine CoA-transferase CaiB-like acyl-CoA transferase
MSEHRKPYKTKDGYIAILPYLDAHWKKFCELSGRIDLLEDARFASLSDRVANIDDTYEETAKTMVHKTTQEWLDIFGQTSVPTNAVNTLDGVIDDPHLKAVGFWQELDHPTEGKLRMTRFPVTFSGTPVENKRHQPVMGEHSIEVLKEAGLSDDEIQAMLDSKATLAADL